MGLLVGVRVGVIVGVTVGVTVGGRVGMLALAAQSWLIIIVVE